MIEILSALSNDPQKNAQTYTQQHKVVYAGMCAARVGAQIGLLGLEIGGIFTMGLGTLLGIAVSVPVSSGIMVAIGYHAYQYLTD